MSYAIEIHYDGSNDVSVEAVGPFASAEERDDYVRRIVAAHPYVNDGFDKFWTVALDLEGAQSAEDAYEDLHLTEAVR